MLRITISLIVILFDFIFAIPYFILCVTVGLFSRKTKDAMSKGIIFVYLQTLAWISGCKVTYKGLEKIPKDRAVLYVGNHSSYFDVIFTYPILPGNVGYIAKKEFERIPILSQAMKLIYCLFLDRNDIKQGLKIILKAIDYIKDGVSIFLFPEGTRTKDGNMAEFKEGGMKIATKSGCPIIPVAISNTSAVFEDNFPRIKAVPVIIEFGDPIYMDQLEKDELKHLGKTVHDIVLEMRDKNYQEIR